MPSLDQLIFLEAVKNRFRLFNLQLAPSTSGSVAPATSGVPAQRDGSMVSNMQSSRATVARGIGRSRLHMPLTLQAQPQHNTRLAALKTSQTTSGTGHRPTGQRTAGASGGSTGGTQTSGQGQSQSSGTDTAIPMTVPPALFRAANNTRREVDEQRRMNDLYDGFIHGIVTGICAAFDLFRCHAELRDVSINGPIATGGRIVGGNTLGGFVMAFGPHTDEFSNNLTMTIGRPLGECWDRFCLSVMVPGMPWYPAFTAWPAPRAPSMPNIPMPFGTLAMNHNLRSADTLRSAMVAERQRMRHPPPFVDELLESVAFGFEVAVDLWVWAQQVMQVMGSGPVPAFAPPYVPVGPVVGGEAHGRLFQA